MSYSLQMVVIWVRMCPPTKQMVKVISEYPQLTTVTVIITDCPALVTMLLLAASNTWSSATDAVGAATWTRLVGTEGSALGPMAVPLMPVASTVYTPAAGPTCVHMLHWRVSPGAM